MLAQLDLLMNQKETKTYKNDVYLLPEALVEKVANLHLPALGAEQAQWTSAGPLLRTGSEIWGPAVNIRYLLDRWT